MAIFNPYFWEVQTDSATIERIPLQKGLYYQTQEDRKKRWAMQDFYQEVRAPVFDLLDASLTPRQREVVTLYYLYNKTQEDIAVILQISQSTVSRHLFGTVRAGKKVGGAIPKLRKAIDKTENPEIWQALLKLQSRLS